MIDYSKIGAHMGKVFSKPEELVGNMPANSLVAGAGLLATAYLIFAVMATVSGLIASPDILVVPIMFALGALLFIPALLLMLIAFVAQRLIGGKASGGDFAYAAGLVAVPFYFVYGLFMIVVTLTNLRSPVPLDLFFLIFMVKATNAVQGVTGWKGLGVGIIVFLAYLAMAIAIVLLGAALLASVLAGAATG